MLFLQSLQLRAGTPAVLEGVAFGLAGTAIVGTLTFWLHHKLPYKKMLVLTGVLLGVVLVVMTGGTAATFQDLGWLPMHELPVTFPAWLGAWFEIYPTYETIACQLVAAVFVIGSYFLADYVKVRRAARPRRAGRRARRGAARGRARLLGRRRLAARDLVAHQRRDARAEQLDRVHDPVVGQRADAHLHELALMAEDLVVEEELLGHLLR